MTHDEINSLADCIVRHPLFRKMVKEMTLLSAIERETMIEAGAVSSFLAVCIGRGIEWKIDQQGALLCTHPEKLKELRNVFDRYRGAIRREVDRLQRFEEEVDRRRERADEPRNYETNGHQQRGTND